MCSPNNPTGRILKEDLIISLINKFPNSIFIIDEAYMDFCENLTLLNLINKYPNLIFVKTFSKAFSLAGLRVGYGIYNSKRFDYLQDYINPKSISLLSSVICKKVLDENLINNYLEDVKKFKDLLRDMNNPNVESNYGNFYLYKPFRGVEKYMNRLKQSKIYVRDRSFMKGLKGYVRVSIVDYDTMIKNLDILFEKD